MKNTTTNIFTISSSRKNQGHQLTWRLTYLQTISCCMQALELQERMLVHEVNIPLTSETVFMFRQLAPQLFILTVTTIFYKYVRFVSFEKINLFGEIMFAQNMGDKHEVIFPESESEVELIYPVSQNNTTRFRKICFSKALLHSKFALKLSYLDENGYPFYYQ